MDKFQLTCNIEICTNCCIEKEKCIDHKCNDDDAIASGDIYWNWSARKKKTNKIKLHSKFTQNLLKIHSKYALKNTPKFATNAL